MKLSLSFLIFVLLGCQHAPVAITTWQSIPNRASEPSVLASFTDANGNVLKRIKEAPLEQSTAIERIKARQLGLALLSQRFTEPYYGTERDQAGCLNESEIKAPAQESKDQIKKQVLSVSNKNFVLVGCADSEAYFKTQLTYVYCKKDKSYREYKLYTKLGSPLPVVDFCAQ